MAMVRVLVVDDDSALRDMLEIVLTGEGYSVRQAAHGGAAIAILKDGWDPHVILLDLLMPIIDGWQVCTWLETKIPAAQRPPVIILTASLSPQLAPPNAAVVLAKPFNVSTVLQYVQRLAATVTVPIAGCA
jgi:CheY-like chemotaxis protein